MSHNPAKLFQIEKRGFIKEGYFADLVLIDPEKSQTVSKENVLYKCGWSPLEGKQFKGKVLKTLINGHVIYDDGIVHEAGRGMRVHFSSER